MTNLKSIIISKQSIKYWLILIGFIIVIFIFSQQNSVQSNRLSNSVAKGVLQMTQFVSGSEKSVTEAELAAQLSRVNKNLRRFAHFFIYMCLMLVTIVFFKRRHNRFVLIKAAILCSGLAVFDEAHQYFVPGRTPQMKDLMLDELGILAALLMYGVIGMLWGIGKWVASNLMSVTVDEV